MPMPPTFASAIAIRASVTVSIAELIDRHAAVDVAGDTGAQVGHVWMDVGVTRLHQHIVEGEWFESAVERFKERIEITLGFRHVLLQ
jgi:hypothetical protein